MISVSILADKHDDQDIGKFDTDPFRCVKDYLNSTMNYQILRD